VHPNAEHAGIVKKIKMQRKNSSLSSYIATQCFEATNMAASPARPAKLGFKPDSPIALACRLLSNNNSMVLLLDEVDVFMVRDDSNL
jgi:hypothetical protein